MSIFDSDFMESASDFFNKGADKVTSAFDTATTKVKLNDLQKKREAACASLGAAVFVAKRDDAEFRAAFEELFAGVEAVDKEAADVEAALAAEEAKRAAREAAAAAAKAARAAVSVCATCGETLVQGALFCGNCGTKIPEPEPVPEPVTELVCPSCGQSVPADAAFCSGCGTRL